MIKMIRHIQGMQRGKKWSSKDYIYFDEYTLYQAFHDDFVSNAAA